jgi:GNAT superfamily N-acetyltransferase
VSKGNLTHIEARELDSSPLIQAAQRLRHTVWQEEGVELHDSPDQMIADSHDQHAHHWGIFDGDVLIGTARLCIHMHISEAPEGEMFVGVDLPTPIASLNRMGVLKPHRGRGLGRHLDDLRIAKARELGASVVIGTPRNIEPRRRSMQRRGFKFLPGVLGHPTWSPSFEICACYLILPAEIGRSDD